jgi:hypothetical protein
MTPADLSSLADNLEKRCENVDQLDFLVGFLAWISDKHSDFHFLVNDFAVLADHCYEISDKISCGILASQDPNGQADDAEEVADAINDLHAILGAKYCRAVGRA